LPRLASPRSVDSVASQYSPAMARNDRWGVFRHLRPSPKCYDSFVIDEELTSPEAFSLAVRARASYFARHTSEYGAEMLRPYAQLTLLLGIELEDACAELTSKGLRYAYRWAVAGGGPVASV
jgi:hypothetical protein